MSKDMHGSIQVLCNQIMSRNGFSYSRRREWVIYGARGRKCSECKAKPGEPCLHLAELKLKPREYVKINRQPHPTRVDWHKIFEGLKQRGYR